MKNKIFFAAGILAMVFVSCDFFDPSAVNDVIVSVDRDNPLDHDFWEQKTTFPGSKRSSAVLFVNGDEIYYGLGENESDPLIDMWIYKTLEETMTVDALSNYRDPAFFAIGDKIYTGGGHYPAVKGEAWDDDIETESWHEFAEYDPATNGWVSIPNLPDDAGWCGRGFFY